MLAATSRTSESALGSQRVDMAQSTSPVLVMSTSSSTTMTMRTSRPPSRVASTP